MTWSALLCIGSGITDSTKSLPGWETSPCSHIRPGGDVKSIWMAWIHQACPIPMYVCWASNLQCPHPQPGHLSKSNSSVSTNCPQFLPPQVLPPPEWCHHTLAMCPEVGTMSWAMNTCYSAYRHLLSICLWVTINNKSGNHTTCWPKVGCGNSQPPLRTQACCHSPNTL